MHHLTKQAGFTLIELMVTMALVIILFALSAVNLGQPQTTAGLNTTVDTLLNDLKSQQLLAMSGGIGSTAVQQPHGIYIQSNQYTLYAGSTFNGGDTNNYVVSAPANMAFSTTFPSSTVLFNKGAGDVSGFVGGSNTITVTYGSSPKVITINRFGATTVN